MQPVNEAAHKISQQHDAGEDREPVGKPGLRKANAMSTGMRIPKVGKPSMLRSTQIMSAPIGTRRNIRKVVWNSGGREKSDQRSSRRLERRIRSKRTRHWARISLFMLQRTSGSGPPAKHARHKQQRDEKRAPRLHNASIIPLRGYRGTEYGGERT